MNRRKKFCFLNAFLAVFFSTPGYVCKHAVENRKDDAERQRPPKTIYGESRSKIVDQQDNDCIDDDEKKPQGENCNRNCKNDQNWLNDKIGN